MNWNIFYMVWERFTADGKKKTIKWTTQLSLNLKKNYLEIMLYFNYNFQKLLNKYLYIYIYSHIVKITHPIMAHPSLFEAPQQTVANFMDGVELKRINLQQ